MRPFSWSPRTTLLAIAAAVVLTVLYARAWWFSDLSVPNLGYLQTILAQSTPAFQVVGIVIVTMLAATSGAAARHSQLMDEPRARGSLAVMLPQVAPALLVGGVAWLVAVSVSALYAEAPVLVPTGAGLVAAQLSLALSWAGVGYALGRTLGRVGVIPAPFLAFAFFAMLPGLLGRAGSAMNGNDLYFCCTVVDTTPISVIASVLLTSAGVAAAALSALVITRGGVGLLWPACAATLLVGGYLMGTASPFPPTVPRSGDLTCESHGRTEVCLWPEQMKAQPATARLVAGTADRLRDTGVDVPTLITADRGADPVGAYRGVAKGPDDVRRLALASMTDGGEACGAFAEQQSEALLRGFGPYWMWLLTAADLDTADQLSTLGATDLEAWHSLQALPRNEQVVWVNEMRRALQSCASSAPPVPQR